MAEGITLKRIIDMDEATELTSSDYALVDSATGGPKKFVLGDELSSLKEDYSDILNSAYVTDNASGSIASFPDGADSVPVKSLTVNIEPVQDLHGYEHPWPGGGNVNKLPPAASFETITSGNSKITPYPDGHYHLSKTAGSDSDMFLINLASPVTVSTNQYIYHISNANSGNMIANLLGNDGTINGGYWGKSSANIASEGIATKWQFYFTAGIAGEFDFWPVISDAPVSEFTPYSNICPISGHTSAMVTRTGVNVWDEEWIVASNNRINSKNPISVVSGESYYFKTPAAMYINAVDKNGAYVSYLGGVTNGTMVIPDGVKYIGFSVLDSYGSTYNHDISINYPSTDHDYHEGHVQTVTVDLGQTVYGGTLDVDTGAMTVDRAMVDLGTLTWTYSNLGSTNVFYAPFSLINKTGYTNADAFPILCSRYTSVAFYSAGVYMGGIDNGVAYAPGGGSCFYITDSAYTDAAAFKAAMSGVMLVYELATPQTVQLTAQEVRTLLGTNNIWSDAGNVDVTYRADTKLYIEKLTAPTENDMVADANIVSGQYFMVGNTLYKATANIASGGAITPNVNSTRKSLPEALNEINA